MTDPHQLALVVNAYLPSMKVGMVEKIVKFYLEAKKMYPSSYRFFNFIIVIFMFLVCAHFVDRSFLPVIIYLEAKNDQYMKRSQWHSSQIWTLTTKLK